MTIRKLSHEELDEQYNILKEYHKKHLEEKGVSLPPLTRKGKYVKDALILIALSLNYPETNKQSKSELTEFVNYYFDDKISDMQQARHLGAQKGWFIQSGMRDNNKELKRGEYKLTTLEKPYPRFKNQHRSSSVDNPSWEEIKKKYKYHCATCGSKEGEPHLHWPETRTALQKGHMDPHKELSEGNIIPQCQICNQGDRDRWVYDDKGRVIALANHKTILSSSEHVQKEAYKLLEEKFGK